jgi:hypothetical protein
MAKAKRPATPAPEPTPAKAIAKAKQSGPVVKITRAKAIAEGRPPIPAAPEVQTTSSKRGPGPDDQPNKKEKQEPSRKRGKPEAGTIPAEEKRKPQIIIESPSKAKTPDVIATVRSGVKAKALDDDLLSKFLAIGIPSAEDEKKIKTNKEYILTLKEIYKEGVWKKAKVNRSGGGGRIPPVY